MKTKSYLNKIELALFLFNAGIYNEVIETLKLTESEINEIKLEDEYKARDIMQDITILRLVSDIQINKNIDSVINLSKLLDSIPTITFKNIEKILYLSVINADIDYQNVDFLDEYKFKVYSELHKTGLKLSHDLVNKDTIKTEAYIENKDFNEKEKLFNNIYNALQNRSYIADILIKQYENQANTTPEKRLLNYFKIRLSIINNDFEYGKQALINLYNLKEFNSENIYNLVDINNAVVLFISSFRQKGYKFTEFELGSLYEKSLEIVYGTPYELSLFIEKAIFESENNNKINIYSEYSQIKNKLRMIPSETMAYYDNLITELIKD